MCPWTTFLSTPPVWVATFFAQFGINRERNFYPRHPCGWRRRYFNEQLYFITHFYPRHPCGWRPVSASMRAAKASISIHATRVGGDIHGKNLLQISAIFLSTPPVWVATVPMPQAAAAARISIHATRVGGDGIRLCQPLSHFLFLSTPPVWVATNALDAVQPGLGNFYPRHPCGWRQMLSMLCNRGLGISIHATRVGGDNAAITGTAILSNFYPRHPCGWRPSTFMQDAPFH